MSIETMPKGFTMNLGKEPGREKNFDAEIEKALDYIKVKQPLIAERLRAMPEDALAALDQAYNMEGESLSRLKGVEEPDRVVTLLDQWESAALEKRKEIFDELESL